MMNRRVLYVTFLLCLLPAIVLSQKYMGKRKHMAVFPDPLQYKLSGWYFSPGVTYSLPWMNESEKTLVEGDTSLVGTFDPGGKIGLYLEAGRYHILEYSFFKYLDYGIAYKSLRGQEAYETKYVVESGNTEVAAGSGEGKYSDHFVSGHFNLNHIKVFADDIFLQNSLGINVDYAFLQNRQSSLGVGEEFPGNLVAQLHYKIGVGFKVSDDLLIIPSIETPVLNGWTFENGKSTLGYFNTRYRPLILSFRFLFFRQEKTVCPPVYNPNMPEGITPDGMQ